MKIRLSSALTTDSIVDGEGVRSVIWTQGCAHNCPGCHNPQTHDFNGGFLKEIEELKEEIRLLKNQDGITLSGGDPFFQVEACLEIAKYCHKLGLNVWCYTGFTFEQLLKLIPKQPKILELLNYIDILVDGRFIQELKSFDVVFRGSKNQRILDVPQSLKLGKAILAEKYHQKPISQFEIFRPACLYV